ncbi:hypothetical protein BD779DRAFT_1533506 [Infundibulicybe gibba]|nr:hypothetical protein BD779DRAFT_1533506 [Infundibulicybe gibba]
MSLYQIPPFEFVPASSGPNFIEYTPHTWRVPCCGRDLDTGGMSPTWTDGDTTSFIISTTDGVQAVTIPTAPGRPPLLTKLNLNFHSYGLRHFCLGRHNSISIHGYACVTALTHRWADIRNPEPNRIVTSRLHPTGGHPVFYDMGICLDEASARLVFITFPGLSVVLSFLQSVKTIGPWSPSASGVYGSVVPAFHLRLTMFNLRNISSTPRAARKIIPRRQLRNASPRHQVCYIKWGVVKCREGEAFYAPLEEALWTLLCIYVQPIFIWGSKTGKSPGKNRQFLSAILGEFGGFRLPIIAR